MPPLNEEKKPARSTGPRTPEGKAKASENSIKHGCCSKKVVMRGESQAEFDQLQQGWMDDYEPGSQIALSLVKEACIAQWVLLRNRGRFNEAENSVAESEINALDWTEEQQQIIERFRRYLTQAERQFSRAFSMLEQLRGNRLREGMTLLTAEQRGEEVQRKRKAAAEKDNAAAQKQTAAAEKETAGEAGGKENKAAKRMGQAASPATPAGTLFNGQNSAKKRKKVYLLEQWVEVTDEDDGTVTRLYPSNKNLIERGKTMWPAPDLVYRRINFPDGVPAEYGWVGVDEDRRLYGGCGIQRMTPDTWLEVIGREAAEEAKEGYQSSVAPGHIGPTGVGNLPRPQERGGCECPVCTRNQAILDAGITALE